MNTSECRGLWKAQEPVCRVSMVCDTQTQHFWICGSCWGPKTLNIYLKVVFLVSNDKSHKGDCTLRTLVQFCCVHPNLRAVKVHFRAISVTTTPSMPTLTMSRNIYKEKSHPCCKLLVYFRYKRWHKQGVHIFLGCENGTGSDMLKISTKTYVKTYFTSYVVKYHVVK